MNPEEQRDEHKHRDMTWSERELLHEAGIHNAADLRQADPQHLEGELERINTERHLVDQVPTIERIETWSWEGIATPGDFGAGLAFGDLQGDPTRGPRIPRPKEDGE